MLTFEEMRVLTYLRTHVLSTFEEITRVCLPSGSRDEAVRILWNLEWLGYVVRYGPDAVQITHQGKSSS